MKVSDFQGVVAWSGGDLLMRAGQKFDNEHPLVSERPDLFRSVRDEQDAEETQTAANASGQRVETTMQHPGGNRVAAKPRSAGQ